MPREDLKIEMGALLLGQEHLAPPTLKELFDRVHSANTPPEILQCLISIHENGIRLNGALEEGARDILPQRREIVVSLLTELLSKLQPPALQELFDHAQDTSTLRAFINFLTKCSAQGIDVGNILKEEPKVEQAPGPKHNIHKSDLVGMQPKNGGEYTNSPQKDVAREHWRRALKEKFKHRDGKRLKVFGLFGEEAREVPIYTDDLKIPPSNLHSAEFHPAVYERTQRQGYPFEVFQGNCWEFSRDWRARHGRRRATFDIVNIDLCSPMDAFWDSADMEIIQLLAPDGILAFNSRVRQDTEALEAANASIMVIAFFFPEILQYIQKLIENKTQFYGSEEKAKNVALREVYFAFKLVMSLPYHTKPCCREREAQCQRKLNAFEYIYGRYVAESAPESWGSHPADHLAIMFEKATKEDIHMMVDALPLGYRAMVRKGALKEAKPHYRELRTATGQFSDDDMAVAEEIFGLKTPDKQDERNPLVRFGLVFGADDETLSDEDWWTQFIQSWVTGMLYELMTRRLTCRKIENIERLVYTHDNVQSFQQFIVSFKQEGGGQTFLKLFKEILDRLVNSSETVIRGNMTQESSDPGPISIYVKPEHLDGQHGHKTVRRSSLSRKDQEKRRKRRDLARESRKENR